jgi:hypothetical protein
MQHSCIQGWKMKRRTKVLASHTYLYYQESKDFPQSLPIALNDIP